jgi:hypothetical protein
MKCVIVHRAAIRLNSRLGERATFSDKICPSIVRLTPLAGKIIINPSKGEITAFILQILHGRLWQ